jgi:hypothetical protein
VRLDDPRATLLNQPVTFGPGTVAIIAGDLARYSAFWFHAFNVQYAIPEGTTITGRIGSDIAGARNEVIRDSLETDVSQWVWFIDDDHTFPHEIVMKLLAHEVDVVTPLVLRRQSPFLPVATVDDNFLDLSANWNPDDLVKVQFVGSSGMLIRRKVLEALDPPWFDLGYDEEGRRVSEDVNFCKRAAEAGFGIYVDMAVTMSHMTTAAVRPVWDEEHNEWMTGITLADGYTIYTGVTPPPQTEGDT